MRIRLLLVFAALLTPTAGAHAQAEPDSIKLRNDCRLAMQVLTTGHPAPRLEWARGFIGYCGNEQWATAKRAAILRLRASADENELGREWRFVWMLRDAELFNAVLQIAQDRNASTAARLWSLRTLANYIDPEGSYGALTRIIPGSREGQPQCITGRAAGHMHEYSGKPLPSDFAAQARNLARALVADSGESLDLRTAAKCVVAAPVYGVIVDAAN